jgi:serine protease Do
LTAGLAKQLEIEEKAGVVITSVKPGGLADNADLARGDVIFEVNHQKVANVDEFKSAIKKAAKGSILLVVSRNKSTFFVVIER